MTAEMINALLMLAALAVWLITGLVGWVIPMPDSAQRFTFRYLAWGSLAVFWLTLVHPWRWWSIADLFLAVFAIYRTSHWWEQAEARRKAAIR